MVWMECKTHVLHHLIRNYHIMEYDDFINSPPVGALSLVETSLASPGLFQGAFPSQTLPNLSILF